MDVIMIVSFAKTHPRTELQFPLWQITTQETLNNPNADIHVLALILNSIRVFPEAIKRGICALFLSNEDGERSATSVSTYLFSAEGKVKRSSNF